MAVLSVASAVLSVTLVVPSVGGHSIRHFDSPIRRFESSIRRSGDSIRRWALYPSLQQFYPSTW
ncbi:hypothetical protein [Lysinibacillus xylanilyticus]|uniref:hypothetical protein n=1 Tax=Lysinibacillus xylanilyticus TaxID=582475 RepID=UPI003CFEF734